MSKQNKSNKVAVVAAPVAPVITKVPKTILENGLSYALVSRLLNAMDQETRTKAEKGDKVSLVDGRGETHEVSSLAITLAASLGAKQLSSVKSAFLRPRLCTDFETKVCSLDESKVKVPFIKRKEG
jgi:hypothetical protein